MSLVDTMRAAGGSPAEGRQIVTFNVDDRVFGIDVGVVREIKGWQEATPLPHAAPYVRGVINLRGLILAVYDLRARLGGGLTSATPKHVNLVVDVADRTAGLLVDAVSDIVDVPAMRSIRRPPSRCRVSTSSRAWRCSTRPSSPSLNSTPFSRICRWTRRPE